MKTSIIALAALTLSACTPYAQSYQPAVDQQMSPANARNYDADLSACRESIGSATVGHDRSTAKGAAVGALGGAGVGALSGFSSDRSLAGAGAMAGIAGLAGMGIGAIIGRYESDAAIRRAMNACLQNRGWIILDS